jgi:hypothetical protein
LAGGTTNRQSGDWRSQENLRRARRSLRSTVCTGSSQPEMFCFCSLLLCFAADRFPWGHPRTAPQDVDALNKKVAHVGFFLDNFFPSSYRAPQIRRDTRFWFSGWAHPPAPQRSHAAIRVPSRQFGAGYSRRSQPTGFRGTRSIRQQASRVRAPAAFFAFYGLVDWRLGFSGSFRRSPKMGRRHLAGRF